MHDSWSPLHPDPASASGVGTEPTLGITYRDTRAHVTVHGEIDLATAPALDALLRQPPRGGRGVVVVDLRDCTFIESSIVAVLLAACERLRRDGGEMAVVVARGPVRRTLELCGVCDMLHVVDEAGAGGQSRAVRPALRALPGEGTEG